ncbi:MAG: PLDc N-terminal domain-containing protein [Defluviitaleaceae bacterium]|nr:PLDc N-terminal domain-containing protein [Defluviitaleaceae bacterium]
MVIGNLVVWIVGIGVVTIVPWVLALVSILTKRVPIEEKLLWCLIITLAWSFWIGIIIYFTIGRKQLKELEAKGGAA